MTNGEVLASHARLEELGNYAFGSRARYAIRYNLARLEKPARLIEQERQAILGGYGAPSPETNTYVFADRARQQQALDEVNTFLKETDAYRLRVIREADLGEVIFPPNLLPLWFCPLEEEGEGAEAPSEH